MGKMSRIIGMTKKRKRGFGEMVRRVQEGRTEDRDEQDRPRGAPIRPERQDRRRMMGRSRNRSLMKARLGD